MKKRRKCDARNYHLSIRLSKEEYELIDKLAKDEGLTKANLIMQIFLNYIKENNE